MNNRVALLTALLTTSSTTQIYAAKHDERPNIVFVLTDDQPFTLLGHSGHPSIETPNLDRLAERGTFFDSAYTSSPTSKPSRTCILTGRYERSHGVNFNSASALNDDAWQECYPMLLKKSGYFIGYIGKNHTPAGDGGYYSGLMERSYDYWFGRHQALQFYPKEIKGGELFKIAKADTQVEIMQEGMVDFLTDQEYNAATGKRHKRKQGQPFFLNVCLNVPHGAGCGTMELRDTDPKLYTEKYRQKGDYIPRSPLYVAEKDVVKEKLPSYVSHTELLQPNYRYIKTAEALRERNTREMAAVTGVDNMVGTLLQTLEQMGVADNTIIAFTTDNGLFNGEYGIGGKGLCYEIAAHVPMFIYDPRLPAKSSCGDSEAMVLNLDLSPTFLDYAGVEIPADYQGFSLRPIVEGRNEKVRDYLYIENMWSTISGGNPNCVSVRDQAGWKYIRYYKSTIPADLAQMEAMADEVPNATERKRTVVSDYDKYRRIVEEPVTGKAEIVYEELYNIAGDPDEAINLAGEATYADIMEHLSRVCDEQIKMARGEGEPRVYHWLPYEHN